MDGTFSNTSMVGRDENQEYISICAEPFWSKYAVCIEDGSTCMLTTDVTCLKDINAEAVLNYKQDSDYITPGTYTLMRSHSLSVYWKRLIYLCLIYVQSLEI